MSFASMPVRCQVCKEVFGSSEINMHELSCAQEQIDHEAKEAKQSPKDLEQALKIESANSKVEKTVQKKTGPKVEENAVENKKRESFKDPIDSPKENATDFYKNSQVDIKYKTQSNGTNEGLKAQKNKRPEKLNLKKDCEPTSSSIDSPNKKTPKSSKAKTIDIKHKEQSDDTDNELNHAELDEPEPQGKERPVKLDMKKQPKVVRSPDKKQKEEMENMPYPKPGQEILKERAIAIAAQEEGRKSTPSLPDLDSDAEAAYESHLQNLVPCDFCARKFTPDRVMVHQQACIKRSDRRRSSRGIRKT